MAEPRGCSEMELERVVELCNLVFRPEDGDMGSGYPLLFHPDNTSRLRTIWDRDRPVCHAGYVCREAWILGASFQTASVGAVCTHPEHRNQGHASRVMADLEAHARAAGCDLMLVSGSRALYRRMGCVKTGRFPVYSLDPRQLPRHECQVRQATESDALALVQLHQSEPVRFERLVDDWKLMLASRNLMNSPSDAWIVEHNGAPAAYFAAQEPDSQGHRRVLEYGGSRTAIWGALSTALGDSDQIHIVAMPGDHEIGVLAGSQAPGRERGFAGTVKILNPDTFFEKAQAILFERLGDVISNDLMISTGLEGITFEWEGDYLDITPAELPWLVFGPPPGEAPLTMPEGPLGEILRSLFPLPLLWYGYNYI